jgi:hypothetical protein
MLSKPALELSEDHPQLSGHRRRTIGFAFHPVSIPFMKDNYKADLVI